MRDYTEGTIEDTKIPEMAEKLGLLSSKKKSKVPELPTLVDLRSWCSPIENQMDLGSCTAHASVGVIEYFQSRAFGKYMTDQGFLFTRRQET
ncbi:MULTISPECIES: hypothetical protein [Methanosarcina]|uniref:hypothetical protein n=1 Tax=Methanosarcina TaxID=2207 RepID=UPI000AF826A7|nr:MULTISPECIES: hypothetical protein [Methanosarcina]